MISITKTEKTRLLNAEISFYLAITGYSKEQLSLKIGISLASYYNKMKDIDTFTYRELVNLFKVLKLDDETRLKLLS